MGIYGSETRDKLKDFGAMMALHIEVVSNIFNKHSWAHKNYLYIDAYAGPGYYDPDGNGEIAGSPIIAYDLLSQKKRQSDNFDFTFYAIERDKETCNLLCQSAPYINGGILCGDAIDKLKELDKLNKNVFGLVYFDCDMTINGLQNTFNLIRTANIFRGNRLDILIYLGGSWYKRNRNHSDFVHLADLVQSIPKKHKIIRRLGKYQYTFLIFTDYKGWAEWANAGWYDVNSDKGKKEWDRLLYFNDEIEAKKKSLQPPLFPTRLMQNTYAIPSLELSGRKPSGGLKEFVKDAIIGRLRKFIT